MMASKLRKLTNNIVNRRAPAVLGWRTYARLVATFIRELPNIARAGDLRPLDRSMGRHAKTFIFGGRRILFDCSYIDARIQDGSYAFGIVREILIRNCYFKFLPRETLTGLGTVVDIGANRGMFTTLCAAFAKRVLSVEVNPIFRPIMEHNSQINGFEHVAVHTAFVGAGGSLGSRGYEAEDLSSLLDRYDCDSIDLLKLDIEGSEFELFAKPKWLSRVRRLCMEVHRLHGDPAALVSCLRARGFTLAFADADLRRVGPQGEFDFLYAWR